MQPFATSNLLTLYGIHQRFLNNLVGRYDEQLIKDFYRSVEFIGSLHTLFIVCRLLAVCKLRTLLLLVSFHQLTSRCGFCHVFRHVIISCFFMNPKYQVGLLCSWDSQHMHETFTVVFLNTLGLLHWPLLECMLRILVVVLFWCSYFKEPWAMAVYHDRFGDFRDEVRELLVARPVCAFYFALFTCYSTFCLHHFTPVTTACWTAVLERVTRFRFLDSGTPLPLPLPFLSPPFNLPIEIPN